MAMEIYGRIPEQAPEYREQEQHHPHHTHWLLAITLALLVLLISGLGWTWFSSGGSERPSSREPTLSAPALPEFKLPAAPRPTG
jgi:hypothetical protein